MNDEDGAKSCIK